MEEAEASRYWCHMCSQTVNPITEMETIKCPICQSGFVEEMASSASPAQGNGTPLGFGSDSDRALSLWAPILLGMMANPRTPRLPSNEEDDNETNNHGPNDQDVESTMMMNRLRRRRRSSAAILQLLQGIRAGMQSQSETDNADADREGGRRVILINPFNQTIIIQGSNDPNNELYNRAPIGSLGDYFMGPGLDLLLQHLAENDPNRYGTPPARKEAVDALPTVKIEEATQCCVCLDECEVGADARELPCKHKFHGGCIVPWLELHSSCPVCRYQLPADDEAKGVSRNSSSNQESEGNQNDNGRRFSIPFVWPFTSLFSSSSDGNPSLPSPSTNAPPTISRREDEN